MNKYEMLYIIDNDTEEEQKAALVDRFAELVTSLGGNVLDIDKWGTKRFAYPIADKNEGYYVLMNFEADSTVPDELNRQMRISDNIVRQLILKK